MSRIHEILLIPGAGHLGAGGYSRGHTIDAFAEVDLVDKYVAAMRDELDQSGIRTRVAPTRKAPGLHIQDLYDSAQAFVLPVLCTIGWNLARNLSAAHNVSTVQYGPEVPARLAMGLADVLGHWGGLYVFGHRRGAPAPFNGRGIVLEPFRINGPNVRDYAQRLDALGRDLGRHILDYCRARLDDAVVQPPSMLASKRFPIT